ncbi:hypothetical protein ID866_6928 [Astraeus odoratus]|nr:hypothetical protein ID866_6928 [Astraeus odoratus]
MMWFPRALSDISDGTSALQRLSRIFYAQLIKDNMTIETSQEYAVIVREATFEWESSKNVDVKSSDISSGGRRDGFPSGRGRTEGHQDCQEGGSQESLKPGFVFRVSNINFTVPRGQLVAIVGPVGSGKSSLLQGIIGEMRKVTGHVSFGGRVAYCSQTVWIQNATLRENILFGQAFEEDKYWRVVELACLLPDLQSFPDGDMTEVIQLIGERGINLSGGQKQRVNIARALYFDPEVVIFDDPLSAVDARIGKFVFEDVIIGLRSRGATILLVTHAIHFLSQVDYIYTMKNGMIVERGTFQELIEKDAEFACLVREYGGWATEEKVEDEGEGIPQATQHDVTSDCAKLGSGAVGTGKLEGRLIVKEQRQTGSVSGQVYWKYILAGRGAITLPLICLCVIMMQATQIANSYALIWWEENAWNKHISFYQILYGCLAIGQTIFTFLLCLSLDLFGYFVSQSLYNQSIKQIFHAPISFFDTTPTGRILSVVGKDVDAMDNQLSLSVRLLGLTLAMVLGSVVIVSILEPYFLIIVIVIGMMFSYFGAFYRTSAREIKRLQSMLRSFLYAHFSETLTGLATIRSYGEMSRFIAVNRYYVDLEDRSLLLVVAVQRWLSIRLDFMGSMLTFFREQVALLTVTDASGINPAQIGLVLMFASELLTSIQHSGPPPQWPFAGAIELRDVQMSYRPGLPNVLKGISIVIRGGERVGIVGRTGAGKSSLMLALYRIVELSGGCITLDGIDISTIGLRDLRTKISIIPQDPLFFSGTIRSNLDPFNQYDDTKLWDALHRSCLVDIPSTKECLTSSDGVSSTNTNRYTLDTVIESEGANLSVGERSLLSLARALVKDCKVVVMDEATASVDLETDSKIQHTIKTEFKDRTLLCIAHRLRTILSYDRVLVMDAGVVAEFDTPYNLYQQGKLFRDMCEKSNITARDIETSINERLAS